MAASTIPSAVAAYFDALDPVRRAELRPVFDAVNEAMPSGYALGMHWGMPSWVVPLERFPDTYNGKPLGYVSIAAQSRHNALYLMALYSDPDQDAAFRAGWTASGARLDMGKSCLRFRTIGDGQLELIKNVVASTSVERFLAVYERTRR